MSYNNPVSMTFGFRAQFTDEQFRHFYNTWSGRYRPHEAHANVSTIFTDEELQKLFELVMPYQRTGLVRIGSTLGTKRFADSPDKYSQFTVYRRGYDIEPMFQIEKRHEEIEDQDGNRSMSTTYTLKGDVWTEDVDPTVSFRRIEMRVANTLEKLRPNMRRSLSLVSEHS